jgi:hypothetical protein
MKRLDTKTLPAFLASPGLAVMLVSTEDAAVDAHAYDFTRLWTACVESGRDNISFGYVDVTSTPAARRLAGVSPLPVILVLRDGEVVCRSIDKNLHDYAYRAGHAEAQWSQSTMSIGTRICDCCRWVEASGLVLTMTIMTLQRGSSAPEM